MITPILRVRDVDLSLSFYTRVLGFEGEGGLPGTDGRTVFAEAYFGDARVMFSRLCDYRQPLTRGAELYLTLPDHRAIEPFYAELVAREVYRVAGLHEEIWGDRAFTVTDLDGNRLTFAQTMHYPICEPALAAI